MGNRKVAYILHRFPVLSETFVLYEILEIKKKGIDISVFSFERPADEIIHSDIINRDIFYALNPKEDIKAFIQVIICNIYFFLSSPIKYLYCLFRYFPKIGKKEFLQIFYICHLIKKYSVGHLHAHFACLGATAAMVISRFLKVPFSLTVHAHDIFVQDDFLYEKLRRAEFIIAISRYNRDYLLRRYPDISPSKFKVIHCGVDIDIFSPSVRTPRRDVAILSGGRFVEKKGFIYLIKACKVLKDKGIDFKCTIFGDGPLRKRLYKEVRELGLKEQIDFTGSINRADLIRLLGKSDIFVLPSVVTDDGDRDGIPVTLMEAMSCGKAVISTNISGIPELVTSGENGILVPQRDITALATAIETLIRNVEKRYNLGIRARNRIRESFNIRKNTSVIAELFREKFKILYVNATSYIGGAEISLINLVRRLDRRIFSPIVAVPNDGPLVNKLKELEIEIEFIPTVEFSKKRLFQFIINTLNLVFLLQRRNIDLIHANSIYVAEQSYIAGYLKSVPCICHVRDLVPVLGAGWIRNIAFRKMKGLIAISDAVKNDLVEKLRIPEDNIIKIYNGVDIQEFYPEISGKDFREEFNLNTLKLIGIVGRLSPEKGHEIFLRAGAEVIRRRGNIRLIIIGSSELGPEDYMDSLKGLIEKLNIKEKVIFTGFRDDLPTVMAALDIIIVPSVREPFGRVIIEAMAMEKPVIATDSGGVPEIISEGCGVLVRHGDIEGIVSAVIHILDNKDTGEQMGRKARDFVKERFDIIRHVSEIERLYNNLKNA